MRENYSRMGVAYCELPATDEHVISTELVSCAIAHLYGGKAPHIMRLISEHLVHSHSSLSIGLCKLFKLIIQS